MLMVSWEQIDHRRQVICDIISCSPFRFVLSLPVLSLSTPCRSPFFDYCHPSLPHLLEFQLSPTRKVGHPPSSFLPFNISKFSRWIPLPDIGSLQ